MQPLPSNDDAAFEEAIDAYLSNVDQRRKADAGDLLQQFPNRRAEILSIVRESREDVDDTENALPPLPRNSAFLQGSERYDSDKQSDAQAADTARMAADVTAPVASTSPRQLGDSDPPPSVRGYEIVELLDSGGMGEVYKARPKVEVERWVAIKVIKPGVGGREIRKRFKTECQSLALMNHPNIATVFDVVFTDEGDPALVMEFVDGPNLVDYCQREGLTLRERLRLFQRICLGIQHAHQKQIVHRDLKPQNILVAACDGVATPKIIDFGLARIETTQRWQNTAHTQVGQILGTLQYMSPEGATLKPELIDTRADIYSLGVVLFELLTGTTPLESQAIKEQPLDERLRMVRQQEAVLPSVRLRQRLRNDPLAMTAGSITPQQLMGDLDAICCKATANAADGRYSSVAELAKDIENYLTDMPISAGAISRTYLLSKFARRYRRELIGVLLVAASLLVATGVSITWALRAEAAEAETERQLVLAQQAAVAEAAALEEAEQERALALAVNRFLRYDLLGQAKPSENSNPYITVREVVDRAAAEILVQFDDQPELKGELLFSVAEVYMSLGEVDIADPYWVAACETLRDTLGDDHYKTINATHGLARNRMELGLFRDAEQLMLHNLQIIEADPEYIDERRSIENDLAALLSKSGRNQEGCELMARLIEEQRSDAALDETKLATLLSNYSVFLGAQRRHSEAMELSNEALEIKLRTHGPNHPNTIVEVQNRAWLFARLGDHARALEEYHRAIDAAQRALGPLHPTTLTAQKNLAELLLSDDRLTEAEQVVRDVMALLDDEFSQTLPIRPRLIALMADIQFAQGLEEEAVQTLLEPLPNLAEEFGSEDHRFLRALNSVCAALNDARQYAMARQVINEYWLHDNEMLTEAPSIAEHDLYYQWCRAVRGMNEWELLLEASQQWLEVAPLDSSTWQIARSKMQYDAGLAARRLKRYEQSIEFFEPALETSIGLRGPDYPGVLDCQLQLAFSLFQLEQYPAAEQHLRDLLEHSQVGLLPSRARSVAALEKLSDLAIVYRKRDDFENAVRLHEGVVAFCQLHLDAAHPVTIEAYNSLGLTRNSAGDLSAARAIYERAIEEAGPATAENRTKYCVLLYNLGLNLVRSEEWERAVEVWRQTREEFEERQPPSPDRQRRVEAYYAFALASAGRASEAEGLLINLSSDRIPDDKTLDKWLDVINALEGKFSAEQGELFSSKLVELYETFGQGEYDVWLRSRLALYTAEAFLRLGDSPQALRFARLAVELRESEAAEDYRTANALRVLGSAHAAAGDSTAALAAWRQSYEMYVRDGITTDSRRQAINRVIEELSKHYAQLGQTAEAEQWRGKLFADVVSDQDTGK